MSATPNAPNSGDRRRLRALGVSIGRFPTGRWNAITDVPGVRVGHSTVRHDHGPARTGVTAILPNDGDIFMERLVGGAFVLNGAGEMSGLIQVREWGLIETPILLTNTLSVGAVSQATVRHMVEHNPELGRTQDVIIPLVGECDDSFLNDIRGHHVHEAHVREALSTATSGPVEEGCVGGGTGMVSFDLKGGIGTSSRCVTFDGAHDDPDASSGAYTLGVLVMSNVGRLDDLRIDGRDVGRSLRPWLDGREVRRSLYGSIIAVVATDVPLSTHQLERLSKRVALGIGRVGSYAAHGSGEIVVGFSTGNTIPRQSPRPFLHITKLADPCMDVLYQAAIECTEEAMLNAMCMAVDTDGVHGRIVPALPLDVVASLLAS